jgi:Glycosyltransferase
LKNDFPNIKYIIAGSGRELKNLKKLVSDLNLNNTVIFVDNVNDAQKKYLFKKTKLMIMPTLDETLNRSIEGFGISYLEAAFFRIPSIASNIGGTPEAVINNKTGIIIDDIKLLHSSIKQLLIDEQKISNLGMNAEKRANSSFLWEKIVKQYISLIYELHQSR